MTTLGILGGGHLARLTTQAAQKLGLHVAVLDRNENSPASQVTAFAVDGDWNDAELVAELAQACDVITVETEFVPAEVLAALEADGRVVRPSAKTVAVLQDRLTQKTALAAAGFPVLPHAPIESLADLNAFAQVHGFPVLLKTRTAGYDSKGNAFIPSPGEVEAHYERIAAMGVPMLAEAYEGFYRELCIVGVRSQDGEVRLYPVSEFRTIEGVVYAVNTPAVERFAGYLAQQGRIADAYYFDDIARLATQIAGHFDVIGAFCIELFETRTGTLLVNDVTPRPGIGGHYSIDACVTSLFENHVRALMGLSLGATDLIAKAAVTVTLVGRTDAMPGAYEFKQALFIKGARLHWYGKQSVYRMRKLGHVTALSDTDPEAERIASMFATHLLGW